MRYRHKKRGTVYEIITDEASLQCSAAEDFEKMFEYDNWTVYRNVETGYIWVVNGRRSFRRSVRAS